MQIYEKIEENVRFQKSKFENKFCILHSEFAIYYCVSTRASFSLPADAVRQVLRAKRKARTNLSTSKY